MKLNLETYANCMSFLDQKYLEQNIYYFFCFYSFQILYIRMEIFLREKSGTRQVVRNWFRTLFQDFTFLRYFFFFGSEVFRVTLKMATHVYKIFFKPAPGVIGNILFDFV